MSLKVEPYCFDEVRFLSSDEKYEFILTLKIFTMFVYLTAHHCSNTSPVQSIYKRGNEIYNLIR